MFGFRRKKPPASTQKKISEQLSTATYGGMQEREIQARLELMIDAVLTRHRSVIEPARRLAELSLIEQKRFLSSIDRVSLIDSELAYRLCHAATQTAVELDDTEWELYIDELLESFNNLGIDGATETVNDYPVHLKNNQTDDSSLVAFKEIKSLLEIFIHALDGRAVKLASSTQSYTDTETLYLPEQINLYKTRDENYRLYKSLLVHQWAQTWYGTWRIDFRNVLNEYPDSDRVIDLLHWLETQRLDACLARELPGMAREMKILRSDSKELHPILLNARKALQKPESSIQLSLDYLSQIYGLDLNPEPAVYQGMLCPDQTITAISERREREYSEIQEKLARLTNKNTGKQEQEDRTGIPAELTIKLAEAPSTDELKIELEHEGAAVELPEDLQELLDSVVQDYGEIPERYMKTEELYPLTENPVDQFIVNSQKPENEHRYEEWDHTRSRYREDWCRVHEQSIQAVSGSFVTDTLRKYQALVNQLRRSFEALRLQNRQLKREPFGDDIDIDAVVEAWADSQNGFEVSDRLFIKGHRAERSVAVMFMVDMSASTKGWINRVERESLVLLCDVLDQLGDQYAIYGFSGRGREHCMTYHIKHFDETYNSDVQHRIEGMHSQDNTRLGTAIRHLGAILSPVEARTRLLLVLTDGRPDDIDGYRGQYGIEDTRRALIEMRQIGIHPYCITIDTAARDYLPYMFGESSFTIINEVEKLPQKITDIYRTLTT